MKKLVVAAFSLFFLVFLSGCLCTTNACTDYSYYHSTTATAVVVAKPVAVRPVVHSVPARPLPPPKPGSILMPPPVVHPVPARPVGPAYVSRPVPNKVVYTQRVHSYSSRPIGPNAYSGRNDYPVGKNHYDDNNNSNHKGHTCRSVRDCNSSHR